MYAKGKVEVRSRFRFIYLFLTLALFYLTWAPTKAEHQDDNKEHLYDLLPWFFYPHRIALLLDKFAFEAQVRLVFVLVIFNFERFSRALIILTSISLNLKWDFPDIIPYYRAEST